MEQFDVNIYNVTIDEDSKVLYLFIEGQTKATGTAQTIKDKSATLIFIDENSFRAILIIEFPEINMKFPEIDITKSGDNYNILNLIYKQKITHLGIKYSHDGKDGATNGISPLSFLPHQEEYE